MRTVASSLTLSVAISFGRKTRTVAEPRDELTSARSVVCGSPKSGPPQLRTAAEEVKAALAAGWPGFEIGERLPLAEVALAHELVEHPRRGGRVVVPV